MPAPASPEPARDITFTPTPSSRLLHAPFEAGGQSHSPFALKPEKFIGESFAQGASWKVAGYPNFGLQLKHKTF
jgi:hypothetical protein